MVILVVFVETMGVFCEVVMRFGSLGGWRI